MLNTPDSSEHNFNGKLQGDTFDRKVINVNEKKKFNKKLLRMQNKLTVAHSDKQSHFKYLKIHLFIHSS